MPRLTPVGKVTVAVIVLLIAYFFVLPLLLGLLFPQEQVERKREIKIVAFLKTFDLDSAKLQETLRELEMDENVNAVLRLDIVNVEAEPGKMEQHNVAEQEVPCFIIGNQKYLGSKSFDWLKGKILALAEETAESDA